MDEESDFGGRPQSEMASSPNAGHSEQLESATDGGATGVASPETGTADPSDPATDPADPVAAATTYSAPARSRDYGAGGEGEPLPEHSEEDYYDEDDDEDEFLSGSTDVATEDSSLDIDVAEGCVDDPVPLSDRVAAFDRYRPADDPADYPQYSRPRYTGDDSAEQSPSPEQSPVGDAEQPDQSELPPPVSQSSQHDSATPPDDVTPPPGDDVTPPSPGDVTAEDVASAVLPADHPLMQRFQQALTSFLRRQLTKTDSQLVVLEQDCKSRAAEQEDWGNQLHGCREQLRQLVTRQRQQQQQLLTAAQKREQAEQLLAETREAHSDAVKQLAETEKREGALRDQLDQLTRHEFHLRSLEGAADSEMQLGRKMAERAEQQLTALSHDKQTQNYLVARASEQVRRLQEKVARTRAQCDAQRQECCVARRVLAEAQTELDTLEMERRHLQQVWMHSITAMQKKDSQLHQLQDTISDVATQIHTAGGEVHQLQRSIEHAQLANEQLTAQLRRCQTEYDRHASAHERSQSELEQMRQELSRTQRVLDTTEQQITECQSEQRLLDRQLRKLQLLVEKTTLRKRQAEDAIDTALNDQLASRNVARSSTANIVQMRDATRQLEARLNRAENEASQLLLAISTSAASLAHLEATLRQLADETQLVEQTVSRFEREVEHNNWVLQQRLTRVEGLNKKLAELIDAAGGHELGPLEIEILSLRRSVEKLQREVHETQQKYTRLQTDLLAATQQRDQLLADVQRRRKELLVMEQRKVRLERGIDAERDSLAEVQRAVQRQRRAVEHLSARLSSEKSCQEQRGAEVLLMQQQLCHNVKDLELDCVRLRDRVDESERQKNALIQQLSGCGQQQLIWEGKLQLLQQARDRVHGQEGAMQQVQAMRAEIHRMQVRHDQLTREQERLIGEMERAVDRRENMAVRAEHQQLRQRRQAAVCATNASALQLQALRRKLNQAKKDTRHLTSEIERQRRAVDQLGTERLARQSQLQQLQLTVQQLHRSLTLMGLQRSQNLKLIVLKQQIAKNYQQLLDGKYSVSVRSAPRLQSELEAVDARRQKVADIVQQMTQDRPELASCTIPLLNLVRS